MHIHAVGSGADDAPEAAGAEGQIPVEGILDLSFGIAGQFFLQVRVGTLQPAPVFCFVIHRNSLLYPRTSRKVAFP